MAEPVDHPAAQGLILARVLDGKGGARTIDWAGAREWSPGNSETIWLHLDRTVPGVDDWLEEAHGIDQHTAAALISNDTRPRAFRENDALVAILRGINLNPGAEPEDMIAIQIWAQESRIITLRRRSLQTPRDIAEMLDAGRGPLCAGDMLAELVDQLVAKVGRSIVAMNERIDALEERDPSADIAPLADEISDIRRQCLAMKRYMSPQHEALQTLSRDPPPWLSDANGRDIRETIERLHRYLDDLDVSKESAIVLQDELNNRLAARSSHTMYMLSIVAAIFLPLSFVTGLLGINVGGMPGAHSSSAFWVTVGLLASLMAVQILIFWKIKWL